MLPPPLLPPFVDAATAADVAIERGRIMTETRNKLIRLQEWVK